MLSALKSPYSTTSHVNYEILSMGKEMNLYFVTKAIVAIHQNFRKFESGAKLVDVREVVDIT